LENITINLYTLYVEDVEIEVIIYEKSVVLAVVLEEQPVEEYMLGIKDKL
jgi:hypothetical protein